jgi:phosphonate transport system permease protein
VPTPRDEILAAQRDRWVRTARHLTVVSAIVILSCGYVGLFDGRRLAAGVSSIVALIAETLPPDFSQLRRWLRPLLDTLAMSVAGTAIAVACSFPLALFAARNTSPHPLSFYAARGLLNALRAIPELILGIVFVAAVGFGALPGVLALGLHSIGMVGKFFAEAIEHADEAPVQAVRSAGAGRVQVIAHGILPQVMPRLVDTTLYRWEYNFRASTVMGAVGAGGIGQELIVSLRLFQYPSVSALLILVLLMVTLVDALGSVLRRRFH